ncbi:MAG: type module-associated protein Cmr5 [Pseudomonadota bacterium]|jgi:CRISPR-associated protein Cmr5
MEQTLEQKRAQDAWTRAQGCSDEYQKLAKGLPALIMNSGLMQVMAFLEEKGSKEKQRHCRDLGQHLRQWLVKRFPKEFTSTEFKPFMEKLMQAKPAVFQDITTEAFAWLRWSRQMAAAAHATAQKGA